MNKQNDWNVSYSTIKFFERALRTHDRVADHDRARDIFFTIHRNDGLPMVRVLLIDVYTVGQADVIRARDEFPDVDCIVTSAKWNGYTEEAKDYAMQSDTGLFTLDEFLGALNLRNPSLYVKKDKLGKPIRQTRTARRN